jgi:peroxidase
MEIKRSNLIIIVALIALSNAAIGEALSADYYQQTCPNVTKIVCGAVQKKISKTAVTIPAVIRLFFHDAFITVLCTFIYIFFFFSETKPCLL